MYEYSGRCRLDIAISVSDYIYLNDLQLFVWIIVPRLQLGGNVRIVFNYYLTTYSTHFIYGYMASDIWLRTILIVKKETRCRHIGYSYRLTARVLLYAPSHRQDNTYRGLCYTSRAELTIYIYMCVCVCVCVCVLCISHLGECNMRFPVTNINNIKIESVFVFSI